MSYRVEICPNNRATCSATHCKKEGTKITKGEIRQGVIVMFNEKQSWKYRHWGCVTPSVLHNWKDTCQMDMDLVDGYDTLPPDAQKKVKRAIEHEHVDDDEWNGDIECNRYDETKPRQGMFLKTPKKAAAENGDAEEQPSPSKKSAPKKRARSKHDEEQEPDVEPAPKKAKGRSKKSQRKEEPEPEPEPEPAAAKKSRAKKTKQAAQPVDSDDEPIVPAKKAKAKKGTSKAPNDDGEKATKAPAKRKGRGKKAATADDDD